MSYPLRVLFGLLLLSITAGLVTGSTFFYRLGYLWGFLIVVSYIFSKISLGKLELNRIIRTHRSQVGQIFEERFEVKNSSAFPRIWVEVWDESNLPGKKGSHVISSLMGKDSRSYLNRTRLVTRGVFRLGPTRLTSGDMFGIFPAITKIQPQNTLLVYPRIVNIDVFPSPVGWISGGEALRRRTNQITPNAAGVRDYAPGDPLNRIHWLSTARKERLIVKEFELDPLAEVWIFLDAYRYAHCALPHDLPYLETRDQWRPVIQIPIQPSTMEYAVTIAASLVRYFLRNNRAVGYVSAGRNLQLLPSDRGARQLGKILEALAMIDNSGELPLEGVVEAQAQNIPRGSTVLLISPATGKSIPTAVQNLQFRGFRPIVVMIDAKSFGGKAGSEAVYQEICSFHVPCTIISEGDDLGNKLSQNYLFDGSKW
jgi:uncharacterized protein (DUF58 family)